MKLSCRLLGIIGLVSAPVSAQDFSMLPINPSIISSVARTDVLGTHLREIERANGQDDTTVLSLNAQPVNLNSTALIFTPSVARRKANYARFIERSRRADPAGVDNLVATLATDPVSLMSAELAKVGLSASNVADTYAVYWVEAWQAAHGQTGDSSHQTAQAVKRQAARALLATPEFLRAGHDGKQELADSLLVQALMIGAAKHQANGDQNALRQIASAVRKGAKGMGLDLDAMTLTEAGFVPAKTTGAADPAPGAAREALAATGDRKPGYGLLAAAGGAGLGAAFLIGKAMGRRG